MSLSKEQWAAIEQQLSHSYGSVELVCDGYNVTATIKEIAPFRKGITVYVNGWIKGEWIKGEADEARKFHREYKRYLYSAKRRDEAKAKLKTRVVKGNDYLRGLYEGQATKAFSHWLPYWTNARAFCRHIRKTCTAIEVVNIGYRG